MSSVKVIVIGAGFSGLSAASYLAKAGYEVEVYEKLPAAGGRAQVYENQGFKFDMGPSWYWMPEVFDDYFADFGHKTADYYKLIRLDPGYRVYFGKEDYIDIRAAWDKIEATFEAFEPGAGKQLNRFIAEAQQKYEIAFDGFIDKPGISFTEFLDFKSLTKAVKLDLFASVKKLVAKYFEHPKLRSILEFPVLFLGAMPKDIPALYTLMNYADLKLGTWYPMGGMAEIAIAMQKMAEEQGVTFHFNKNVQKIEVEGSKATGIQVDDAFVPADVVVGAADYEFVDQQLLPEGFGNYTKQYWNNRVMAPSALLYYIGLNKKVQGLEHHNLFFDEDFGTHGKEIYHEPKWPAKPQMYVSVASRSDASVAPENCDALVGLIPVAVDLNDTEEVRERYGNMLIQKMEQLTGESIAPHVLFMKSYAHKDFISDYNAFKGNAYGLANTLKQTAILKPGILNSKLKNLFYTGQLTVPGPGVPPALISGRIVANEIAKRV
tara:strand:- start:645 stop:2117 length:1473 start_codon:yes stop_codon:yes gene_type:complete